MGAPTVQNELTEKIVTLIVEREDIRLTENVKYGYISTEDTVYEDVYDTIGKYIKDNAYQIVDGNFVKCSGCNELYAPLDSEKFYCSKCVQIFREE